jgi:DNA polymerase-3 subunit alpha
MATPLHNHTYHSLIDGVSKPIQIAERVLELGFESCACTDHDHVSGHVEFYKTLSDKGVKPILGIETYQSPVSRLINYKALKNKETQFRVDNFHLILLAMNDTGLKNLWRMNSEAHGTGFYYNARVDWELLKKYNEGVIATSACGLGMIQQALQGNPHVPGADETLNRYLDIFGDRFYLELSTYPERWQQETNLATLVIADQRGVPVVYGNDAHYVTKEQYDLHEAIMALQMGKKVKDEDRMSHAPALYIMSENEVMEHLDYLPKSSIQEALDNTDKIAALCNVTLPTNRKRLPIFIPETKYRNTRDMMLDLLEKAYDKKIVSYNKDSEEYWTRLQNELEVIFGANLVDYFLMVRDYVYWAKDNGIMVGPGRGSVGGSLVAYLLGITEVDPIRYGLIFERFYNAGRETSLPDIDIDFSKEGRDKVKEYVTKKYGVEYVADLGTVIRMQPKSAINDVGRVLSVPMKETQAVTKIIDKAIDAGLQPNWETVLENHGDELAPYMEKYPLMFDWARQLAQTNDKLKDDHVKTFGVHASGVIVGDEPLAEVYPLRWVTKDKKLVTQWDMRTAEEFGFMKVDILGLRNLDTLTELNRILVATHHHPIDFEAVQYQEHPEEMWQILDRGQTIGLFQIEEGGMARQIAKAMKPRSVDDLAAIVAMNRPGPLRSGALDKYLHGRNGNEVVYQHEFVKRVSEDTYGVFLYQEQVINFFMQLGYDLQEADGVRAIMGKKKIEKLAEEFPRYMKRATDYDVQAFCTHCYALHAQGERDCKECHHNVVDAHAVGGRSEQHMVVKIALTIWRDLIGFAKYAFNKAHSVEYGLILLWTLYAKYHYPREFLLASIRTVDKDKKPRYVEEAQRMGIPVYTPQLGRAEWQASLSDDGIMFGWNDVMGFGAFVSKWMVEHTYAGMTEEEFNKTRETNKYQLPNGQQRMVATAAHLNVLNKLGSFSDSADVPKDQKIESEEELLGVAISDDSGLILEDYSDVINANCVPYYETEEDGEYAIAGVIKEIQNKTTKTNKPYALVKIADATDETQFYVWNDELRRLGFIWRTRNAGIFNVKRKERGMSLIDAIILHRRDAPRTKYEQQR